MIVKNRAICLECNTEIESTHRHDFVRCPCGNLAVDGGKDYLKRVAKDFNKCKETSIIAEDKTPEEMDYDEKLSKCHRYGLCCMTHGMINKFDQWERPCDICPKKDKPSDKR